MASDRPNAAEVLRAAILNAPLPIREHTDHLVLVVRATVNAGPDDIVCLLPDGTLSVAVEMGVLLCRNDQYHRPGYVDAYGIPGAKP